MNAFSRDVCNCFLTRTRLFCPSPLGIIWALLYNAACWRHVIPENMGEIARNRRTAHSRSGNNRFIRQSTVFTWACGVHYPVWSPCMVRGGADRKVISLATYGLERGLFDDKTALPNANRTPNALLLEVKQILRTSGVTSNVPARSHEVVVRSFRQHCTWS